MRRSRDEALAEALGIEVVPGWVTFTGALQTTREALAATRTVRAGVPGSSSSANRPSWLAGVVSKARSRRRVELGYEIAESALGAGTRDRCDTRVVCERRGPEVSAVIAHTLPSATPPIGSREGGLPPGRRSSGGRRAGFGQDEPAHDAALRPSLTVAGQAAAGRSGRQPAPRGKSGHRRAGWSGDRPGESRGKVPQKQTA